MDLAVPNNASNTAVNIVLADGYPMALAFADFNAGRKPDLAVAIDPNYGAAISASGSIQALLRNGKGTVRCPAHFFAGHAPVSMAVGDFNRDGKPHLGVANASSSNVTVLTKTTNSFRRSCHTSYHWQPGA